MSLRLPCTEQITVMATRLDLYSGDSAMNLYSGDSAINLYSGDSAMNFEFFNSTLIDF